MFNLHTHIPKANALYSAATLTPYRQSLGIPPYQKFLPYLKNLSSLESLPSNILAIGECGLDRRSDIPFTQQQAIFQQQIKLAHNFHLPLIIHAVSSYNDVLHELKKYHFHSAVVFHGYTGNRQQTQALLKYNNIYLSYGHRLLHSTKVQASLQITPLNRLFLETDTHPHSLLCILYHFAANTLQISCKKLIMQVEDNKRTLFQDNFHVG